MPGLGCALPLDRCSKEVEACEVAPAYLLSRGSLSSKVAPDRVAEVKSFADLATRCGNVVCCIVDSRVLRYRRRSYDSVLGTVYLDDGNAIG